MIMKTTLDMTMKNDNGNSNEYDKEKMEINMQE